MALLCEFCNCTVKKLYFLQIASIHMLEFRYSTMFFEIIDDVKYMSGFYYFQAGIQVIVGMCSGTIIIQNFTILFSKGGCL